MLNKIGEKILRIQGAINLYNSRSILKLLFVTVFLEAASAFESQIVLSYEEKEQWSPETMSF